MSLAVSICLLGLAILGHGYLWTDAVNRLHACSWTRKTIDRLTYSCFAAFLVLPVVVFLLWDHVWLFHSSHTESSGSAISWYVSFCVLWGTYALLRNWMYEYRTDSPHVLVARERQLVDTSSFDRQNLFRAGFAEFLSTVPRNQILQPVIEHKRLAIPGLNPQHEGLKIAHISDLHMTGRIGQRWYEFIIEHVNQLKADIVLITGDIVEKEPCWPWLSETLGKLHAECGVYFVLGNHDFYLDTSKTKRLLEDCGLLCLSDCSVECEWKGAPVQLAGNELPWGAQPADLSKLPAPNAEGLPLRVLLLHSPDQLAWACDNRAQLALAGHTHGGQIRFPLLGPIISPSFNGTRYTSGVFRRDETVLHVTRGITGKTPLRWNCPPEIALLELTGV